MPRCFVGLGGNIGPVEQTFRQALEQLDAFADLSAGRVSASYRTRAVGEAAGEAFINGVATVDTDVDPSELLGRLQSIEEQFGRTREARWGPRALDLDLILYGDEIIERPELRVPHPACWYRRFVLDPMAEIAADVLHPEKRVTFGELRSRLLRRPLPVALAGGGGLNRLSELQAEFPQARIWVWDESSHDDDPALLFWMGETTGSDTSGTQLPQLPLLPRLDASCADEPAEMFVRHALQAALG